LTQIKRHRSEGNSMVKRGKSRLTEREAWPPGQRAKGTQPLSQILERMNKTSPALTPPRKAALFPDASRVRFEDTSSS
jgi:hypothetical protein